MTNLRKLLGRRLVEILANKKMKQRELADKLDMDPQSVSRMVSGKHFPKVEHLEKIIDALNIQPEELFTFSHVADDKELIADINRLITNAPSAKIRMAHKIITALFE